MLIIQQHRGNTFRIGDDVVIRILNAEGSVVRFGIEAPRSITIHRQEIYDKIQTEKHNPKT